MLLDGTVLGGGLWNKSTFGTSERWLASERTRVPSFKLLAEVGNVMMFDLVLQGWDGFDLAVGVVLLKRLLAYLALISGRGDL